MWQQNYTPVGNSLPLSTLVAAIPIFVLLYLIGVRRVPAWKSALTGLAAAILVALLAAETQPTETIPRIGLWRAPPGGWPRPSGG